MSAPYFVNVVVTAGKPLALDPADPNQYTLIAQRIDEYWALVEYQNALSQGVVELGRKVAAEKAGDKSGKPA